MSPMYNIERDKILEKLGWIVVTESPYRIHHEKSNSFATGKAAEIVIDELLENWENYIDED